MHDDWEYICNSILECETTQTCIHNQNSLISPFSLLFCVHRCFVLFNIKTHDLNLICATPLFADGDASPDEEKDNEADSATTEGGDEDNIGDDSQRREKEDNILHMNEESSGSINVETKETKLTGKGIDEEQLREELW